MGNIDCILQVQV